MSALAFKVVIPARYASTRLPGKPLLDLGGKPMVVRVAERARRSGAEEVWVATDHLAVRDAAEANEIAALMTRSDHSTGTDRLAEVVERLGWHGETIVVNVQGDEPMIPPEVIDRLAQAFADDKDLKMATLKTLMGEEDYNNPNAVKVVTDQNGYALYFSRSLLPYPRNRKADFKVYKHVGIYAYRRSFLLSYAAYEPTPLEQIEGLEQLRVLENGQRIKVLESKFQGIGIDTQEDLDAINALFTRMEAMKD